MSEQVTSDSAVCAICRRELNEAERMAPLTDDVGAICSACKYELDVAARRAESRQPVAEVVVTNELRDIRRENAKFLARFVDMQDDISTIRAWVVFMGVVTLLGVIATVLALFGGCLRMIR